MEEVAKQLAEMSAKQKEKVEELNSEIRKLKAMIVKHETRIRFVVQFVASVLQLSASKRIFPENPNSSWGCCIAQM